MTHFCQSDLKKTVARLASRYADADLLSLLLGYADKADRAIGRRIRYPAFLEAVKRAVVPQPLTDPDAIATAMGGHYSYRELALFYDYATLWALRELNAPVRSDDALCDTVTYLKRLHALSPDRLYLGLSRAEVRLAESPSFAGCTEETRRLCRDNVTRYAQKMGISEEEAAAILVTRDPARTPQSPWARLYFPLLILLSLLFFGASFFLCRHPVLPFFLLLPLTETAKQLLDRLLSRLVRPRPIPRKELTSLPESAATLTVITALLTGREEDLALVEKLRNCYFANRETHAHFALLCDLREESRAEAPEDGPTVERVRRALEELNRRYGCSLHLLVRRRRFAPTEGRYLGWERKRGAVIELIRLLRGRETTLSILCGGDLPSNIRYVITLDSDTRLHPGAVRDLVGAMRHPSNRPVVRNGAVIRGHAILQPRMEPSLTSAERTPFSVLSAGAGGSDLYPSAGYETYQTLFGQGIFCGKGIFDVTVFSDLIDGQFPDGAVLSHDLLEGARLRAGALTDVPLNDDLPASPLSDLDRRHRWIRGDVQALAFAGRLLPDAGGVLYRNPISSLARFQLWDNLRRALVPVSALAAILLCFFAPDRVADPALLLALSYLILPCLLSVLRLLRYSGRRFFSYALPGMLHAVGNLFYDFASLCQTAFTAADAILRAGYRMLFSRRRLLEWKTAAESDRGKKGLPLHLHRMIPSLLVGLLTVLLCPDFAIRGLGLLWALFPFIAYRLGKPFSPASKRNRRAEATLTAYARDQWQFFADHVTETDSHLPPDNLQLSPAEAVAHRTSPTNIGLYLIACLSAETFGFITAGECLSRLKRTLHTVERLQKWNGHLYNWYDTRDLSLLGSPYVSTVDSGNFVACLTILAQALDRLDDGSRRVAELREQVLSLRDAADFSQLYDPTRQLLRIGLNTVTGEGGDGCYDLFASEARTTSYYAVATGQLPRRHWSRLGRPLIGREGYLGLASWTGTMFEYWMPALFLPLSFGSLSYEALSFAVREQRLDATHGVWGRSECGYFRFDAQMNYQYKAVGVPSLGLKRGLEQDDVIAPYASFLCLPLHPEAVLENLERLKRFDLYGPYGFYEAIDFTPSRVGGGRAVIRSYMAHHMAMSLIACTNACYDRLFVRDFLADPRMASALSLLEEKIPVNAPFPSRHTHLRVPARPSGPQPRLRRPERESRPAPSHPYASLLSENGLAAVAKDGLLRLTAMGVSLAVDPFLFGDAYRPRFLLSADGEIHDLLAGSRSRGVAGGRLVWRVDTPKLMAEASLSLLGHCRSFVLTLEAEGRFHRLCPLLTFLPSLAPSRDREAHPAYSDLLVTATYLSDESAILYTRRHKDSHKPDLCLAVSFESYGGHEFFETRRDVLGRMYGEEALHALFDRPFSCETGTLVHPFCALKKPSDTRGRYVGNFLLSVGKGRAEALASLKAARQALKGKPRNAAHYAAGRLARTAAEKLAGCGNRPSLPKVAELLLTCLLQTPPPTAPAETYPIGRLWQYGISGDLPLLCLLLEDPLTEGSPLLRHLTDLLAAYKFLALSGIRFDLVLLYESGGDYRDPQRTAIQEAIDTCAAGFLVGHSGGIFLLDRPEDRPLFSAIAFLTLHLDRHFTPDSLHTAITETPPAPPVRRQPERALPLPAGVAVRDGVFETDAFTVGKGREKVPLSYPYALPHFGTLVTQDSLGYTWIGNCHERRITPFRGDPFLDFTGERLLLKTEEGDWDLCACAATVRFGQDRALWEGTLKGMPYTVSATVDPYLPCKVITITLPEGTDPSALRLAVTPVMGERPCPGRPLRTVTEGNVTRFLPTVALPEGYDVGFTVRQDFPSGIGFLLGAYPAGGERTLDVILTRYRRWEAFTACGDAYERRLASLLPVGSCQLPDPHLQALLTQLPYQTLVGRLFARTGFSQSGGAYGFRDQLQDCLAILRFAPIIARRHILRAASHQYEEGDVMHWWHTLRGRSRGVRSRYTDDRLWLPYVAAAYSSVTGDTSVFDVKLPYLSSPPLEEKEHDRYEEAVKSPYRESLYSHCARAIEVSLVFGPHDLPLMGGGDWNDGMNRVGENGGESVWLGMFLRMVLEAFAPIAAARGDLSGAAKYRRIADELGTACEATYADGHFLRAYYGDGTPLGGGDAIDLLPQAFAALSDLDHHKTASGLAKAWATLWDPGHGILRLLDPPYTREDPHDPGYIASYPPGVRENGGQYTHAAVWGALGLLRIGRYAEAARLLRGINPAALTATEEGADRYRGEPYVLAGDVSASPDHPGRCGWSLYTGAAGWYYLAVTEGLMGFHREGDSFSITPCLSEEFPGFTVTFAWKETTYTVIAKQGEETAYRLDGKNVNNLFSFDKNEHLLEITVEKSTDLR